MNKFSFLSCSNCSTFDYPLKRTAPFVEWKKIDLKKIDVWRTVVCLLVAYPLTASNSC